ncbi:hypothetical protein RCO48_21570 [Peribacillus frigoritolerans]|nr:hypothetical protein [Peribacillus frigoritolerans]
MEMIICTKKQDYREMEKDFILFLAIISILSVNIIAPLIMGFKFGFSREVYFETLQVIPFVWICVILLVTLVVNPIVNKLVQKFIEPTDGFNARVLFTILFSVTILSILLTVIGSWIGMKRLVWRRFKRSFMIGHVTFSSHFGLKF